MRGAAVEAARILEGPDRRHPDRPTAMRRGCGCMMSLNTTKGRYFVGLLGL